MVLECHLRPNIAAARSRAPKRRGTKPKVYLLHGIMDSELGKRRRLNWDDVIWLGITDVNARAYVLGTFNGVTPSGASGALDALMDGAIAELIGHNIMKQANGARVHGPFIANGHLACGGRDTALAQCLDACRDSSCLPVASPPARSGNRSIAHEQ